MGDAISVIRARRAEIAQAIADLQDEDQDLETAEAVLARLESGGGKKRTVTNAVQPTQKLSAPKTASKSQPPSQRAVVMEVLRTSGDAWLQSSDIVTEANRLWGAHVPELSLRPLLSAMKREQVIVRDGRLIALRERVAPARRLQRAES